MKRTIALFLAVLLLATSAFLFVACDNRTAEQIFLDAESYMESGEYAKAAADYVRAYEADSQNLDAYVGAMQAYKNLGIGYRVIEICDTLIENIPGNATGYLNAASVYMEQYDYAAALEYYLKQIEMVPDEITGYGMAAKIYNDNEDLEAAMAYAQKMMEKFPDVADGYAFMAEFLIMEERADEAMAIGREMIERFPEEVSGYLYVGYVQVEEKDYDGAIETADLCPAQGDTRIIALRRMVRGKEPLVIEDPGMAAAIRGYREKSADEEILREDVFDVLYIEVKGGETPKVNINEVITPLDEPVASLSDLQYFESLTNAEFREMEIDDYSPIGQLPSISYLGIHSSNAEDISFVRLLSTLTSLTVRNTEIDNFDAVEGLTLIREIDLYNNKIVRLPRFENLQNLTALYLTDNEITDISNLSAAAYLQKVSLAGNSGITSIEALRNLDKLVMVSVVDCGVTDLSPVEHVEDVSS